MKFEPRWMIVQWFGFWAITDHYHGNPDPGPHATKEEANETLARWMNRDQNIPDNMKGLDWDLRQYRIIPVQWPVSGPMNSGE